MNFWRLWESNSATSADTSSTSYISPSVTYYLDVSGNLRALAEDMSLKMERKHEDMSAKMERKHGDIQQLFDDLQEEL